MTHSGLPRANFTMIPNVVREMDLSVHGLALYVHIVSTAGWKGKCYKSARTLAKELRCSVGMITKAKRELLRQHWILQFKTLIEIRSEPRRQGGKPRHIISPIDIWAENSKYFAERQPEAGSAPGSTASTEYELTRSRDELGSSPGEIKNNSERKTKERKTNEEAPPSVSPSPRETKREAQDLSYFWSFLCKLFHREHDRNPTRSEKKLLLELIPILPDEYTQIGWWMGLSEAGYNSREGVGFSLRRRPTSVGAILKNWNSVGDVARYYWKQQQEHGWLR